MNKENKSGGLSKFCEKSMLLLFWVTQLFLTLRLFQPPPLQRLLILLLLTYVLLPSLSPYTSIHSFCLLLFTRDNSIPGPDSLRVPWIPYCFLSVLKTRPRFCYSPKRLSLDTVRGLSSGSFLLFGSLQREHTPSTVCLGQ